MVSSTLYNKVSDILAPTSGHSAAFWPFYLSAMASPQVEAVKSTPQVAEATPARPASILHPVVDFLCAGGLSILVIVPLLLSGREDLGFLAIGGLVWAQYLLNYSHFMASYRLIYRDRETMLAHRWAAFGIPLLLIGYAILAFSRAQAGSAQWMGALVAVAERLSRLALHRPGLGDDGVLQLSRRNPVREGRAGSGAGQPPHPAGMARGAGSRGPGSARPAWPNRSGCCPFIRR